MVTLQHVIDPVISTWVELLSCSIDGGEACALGRGLLAWAVKVAPLINKDVRDHWRVELRAPYLLAYCNFFYGRGTHKTRYLDALPVPMLAAPPPEPIVQLLASRALELQDIRQARVNCVRRLDKEGPGDASHENPERASYPVPDLPAVVRAMVDHVEAVHLSFAAHASYLRHFCTCQRIGCTRPALIRPPDPETIDMSSNAEYWTCCRDGKSKAPNACLPSDMSFCSHGCFAAANSEFQRVVSFEIETPACLARNGSGPTPSRLFRAALSRNSAMERSLMRSQAKKTVHYPSTMADHERLKRERIMMLSVDAGLLYAAECLYDFPPRLLPMRQLPRTEDWRSDAACYTDAVANVRTLYLKYGGGRMTKTGNERWLGYVKDAARQIFDVSSY